MRELGFLYHEEVRRWLALNNLYVVCSVAALARQAHRSAWDGLDILWSKLAATLPMFLFPAYLVDTCLCPRITSLQINSLDSTCLGMEDILFRRSAAAGEPNWLLQMDLRITLVVPIQFRLGSQCFWVSAVALVAWSCREILLRGVYSYSFATYWVQIALFALVLTRLKNFWQQWASRPWAIYVTCMCMLVCVFFWDEVGMLCNSIVGSATPLEYRHSLKFKHGFRRSDNVGGALLTRGLLLEVVAFILCTSFRVPHFLARILNILSELSLPMLMLHQPALKALRRCTRAASGPWVYNENSQHVVFMAVDHDNRPRVWGLVLWLAAFLMLIAASQLAVWLVQRPWAKLLKRTPKVMSRALVFAYLCTLNWDSYSRGYYDLVTPGAVHCDCHAFSCNCRTLRGA